MSYNNLSQQLLDYRRVEKAIRYVEDNFKARPPLEKIAAGVHLSKYHFQRLFQRWAGISPARFMQFLTLEYAKERLAESHDLLDTAFDAGLSGPGRLHDLFVNLEAMTPGEFKRQGADLTIGYGFHPTPFGLCLLAGTPRGICHLGFVENDNRAEALAQLRQNWPRAGFVEDRNGTRRIIRRLFAAPSGRDDKPFHLHLKGTNFQVNVWRALLTIPRSSLVSYQDVAAYLGKPRSHRAVAGAVAANPVAFVIPCHRVIAQSGRLHRYRWGATRKKAILGWEAARFGPANSGSTSPAPLTNEAISAG